MEFDSTQPIWLQLVAEFSRRIAVDDWSPGTRIAGVRELAADLRVNPNTVQRALAELEREGLARAERTSGRFVTEDAARIGRLRRDLATQVADDYVRRCQGFGMTLAEAANLIEERWRGDDRTGNTPTGTEG